MQLSSLIDERSTPSLRTVLGRLLARSGCADIAVNSIRLAVLDLTEAELSRVRRCRILLGRLDARALDTATDSTAAVNAHALLHFLRSGRVEIRSAGLATWAPDFSVFRELDDSSSRACLIGAHYFREPVAANGPSFTVCLEDDAALDLVCRRFEDLWELGYDVRDAVAAAVRGWADSAELPATTAWSAP